MPVAPESSPSPEAQLNPIEQLLADAYMAMHNEENLKAIAARDAEVFEALRGKLLTVTSILGEPLAAAAQNGFNIHPVESPVVSGEFDGFDSSSGRLWLVDKDMNETSSEFVFGRHPDTGAILQVATVTEQ